MSRVLLSLGRKHKPEHRIVLYAAVLLLFALTVIYSISPALKESVGIEGVVLKQTIFSVGALAVFYICANIPLDLIKRVQAKLFLAAIAVNFLVIIPGLGQEINGARRWISLGPLTFQPSSFLKLAFILYSATFLYERIKLKTLNNKSETLYPYMAVLGFLAFLVVVLQKDLGTMIALVTIALSMLWVSDIKLSHLGQLIGAMAAGAAVMVMIAPHRLARITTFLNNDVDVDGAGYHINQALIAIGSGGLFGRGLGRSVQVYGYVPEAANDSIFAIVAEKFGFFGSIVIVGVYIALLLQIVRIARKVSNIYLRFIVIGVFAWIISHLLINVGAMLGLLPLTGITLPLLSLGGTSLLFIMAALGIVFNISKYTDIRSSRAPKDAESRRRSRL